MRPSSYTRGLPPFERHTLDEEGRPTDRRSLDGEQLMASARHALVERFGKAAESVQWFARAAVGLLGEQTHYSNGFAVLLTLKQGVAVSARFSPAESHRVFFKGADATWSIDDPSVPYWARLVLEVADHLSASRAVEVAVNSTVSPSCFDAYMAALGAAVYRSVSKLVGQAGEPEKPLNEGELRALADMLASAVGMPFSPAYPIASLTETPYELELIDTATLEHLPVQVEGGKALSWALVDVGMDKSRDPSFHQSRKEQAEAAIVALREHGFDRVRSFRELEHRDLQRAVEVLPESLRPVARHLVTENRRVQKLVKAARKQDWQFFGALLLMSHHSLRDVWKSTTPELDFVVQRAEDMSMEGVFGGCMTARGGCVLVAGRPYTLPGALRQIKSDFTSEFGREPVVMLL